MPTRHHLLLSILVLVLFLSSALCPLSSVLCQRAIHRPILRLETSMHTATVKRIGVDAAGRYLVSASKDKTLRLWSLPDMVLLQTLRVPIGAGDEGKLYAVAISPDGNTIAAGGWTSKNGLSNSIYLFNRRTGQMQQRIAGLGNVIFHLAFSPDGRYLAASLGAGGMRVWHSRDGSLVGKDTNYGADSHWCDFAADGRLLTSSLDGYLRLYDQHFTLQQKRKAAGGKQPYAAVFSADAAAIAVGFNDSTAVNVLDGDDLRLLYAPDTSGVNNGNLGLVAWSGGDLFAGGMWNTYKVRRWSQAGRGRYRDLPVSAQTIMDIRPLPAGGVAVGSADPAITLLDADADGDRAKQVLAGIADFRNNKQGFLVADDGMRVTFAFELWGKSPASVDLSTRQLTAPPSHSTGMHPPDSDSLTIKDWKDTTHPTLNGHSLQLGQYETSFALAIAPNKRSFLLGAAWSLRRFDRDGHELWQQPVPDVAWAVNISGNGTLAVAAFGDGTIRWYRYSDGELLLSFFPHQDKKRWVLWTPSGYYDASTGGEDLIGWHLNHGKDAAAAFYPASKFRRQFYRPEIVARILQTGSEAEAIKLADGKRGRKTHETAITSILPPTLSLLSPERGSHFRDDRVTLRLRVDAPDDAPLTRVRVRINGMVERNVRLLSAKGAVRELDIPLPPQDAQIMVFGINRNGTSEAVSTRLIWAGKKPEAIDPFKPKLYVLAIGISKYRVKGHDLGLAAKDVTDFSNVFSAQKGKLYGNVQLKLLTDTEATKDNILDGLEWLRREVTSHDVGILFLAGHGMNDNNGRYYFLPHDVNPKRLLRTGLAESDIKATLNNLAGKAVFFVDSCHAGNAIGTGTRTRGSQLSQESEEWNNGAFTKAVVEGLRGKADFRHTGAISIKGLDYYVTERVKALTHGEQSPVAISPKGITDFPIAVH